MGRRSKVSKELKQQAVQQYLSKEKTANEIAEQLQVNNNLIRRWTRLWQEYGDAAFDEVTTNEHYSRQLKRKVVQEYHRGKLSIEKLAYKYGIRSQSVVYSWIESDRNHLKIQCHIPDEKREEIVRFCLEHNKDYKLAMKEYGVSYQRVYNWVKRYEALGKESLNDHRYSMYRHGSGEGDGNQEKDKDKDR